MPNNLNSQYDNAQFGLIDSGTVVPIISKSGLVLKQADGSTKILNLEMLLRDELQSFDDYRVEEGEIDPFESDVIREANSHASKHFSGLLDLAQRIDSLANIPEANINDYNFAVQQRVMIREKISLIHAVIGDPKAEFSTVQDARVAINALRLRERVLTRKIAEMQHLYQEGKDRARQLFIEQNEEKKRKNREKNGYRVPGIDIKKKVHVQELIDSYSREFIPPTSLEEAFKMRQTLRYELNEINSREDSVEKKALQKVRGRECFNFDVWYRENRQKLPKTSDVVQFSFFDQKINEIAEDEYLNFKNNYPELNDDSIQHLIVRVIKNVTKYYESKENIAS